MTLIPTLMSRHPGVRDTQEQALTDTALTEDVTPDVTVEDLENDLDENVWKEPDEADSGDDEDEDEDRVPSASVS